MMWFLLLSTDQPDTVGVQRDC